MKYSGLEQHTGPAIYVLWKEMPVGQIHLAVKTRGDAAAASASLRSTLRAIDSRLPLMPIRPLDDVVQQSVADRRLRAWLGGSIASLAFAIALVGLSAALGRMVAERRRDLAIRAALGASPVRALSTVMAGGALIAIAGIIVGMVATVAAGGVLRTMVYGVGPHDAATLSAVAFVVAIGALVACYVPARRAAAANPLDVLRDE
jgi:putative ABC transport system permease protein